MEPEKLIQHWGYKAEVYEVITEDGYILPLYRIPQGKTENSTSPKPVVYLQHVLENSAADWVINLPSESAAFLFADAGFDVFIGNFRGTTYSKRHTALSPKDHLFWQFSWDQMAAFDLPALLEKTLEISKADKIYYVGHSMGTMTAFAQFSQNQELAQKIKRFYALGPVAAMKNVKSPVMYVAPYTKDMGYIANIFGVDEFLPNNILQKIWAKFVCPNPLTDLLCKNVLLMISGPNTHQINETRVPVIDSHSPAGTSVRNVVHFGQLMTSGNFQAYDYGSAKENQAHYGSDQPTLYDLTKMEVPISVYYGSDDYLATPADVLDAVSHFKNVVEKVPLDGFQHMDFVWGLKAAPLVFQPITESIRKDFSS